MRLVFLALPRSAAVPWLVLLASMMSSGAEARTQTYVLRPDVRLTIEVPNGWDPQTRTDVGDESGVLAFGFKYRSPTPGAFSVVLTGFVNLDRPPPRADDLEDQVRSAGEALLAQSEQTEVALQTLSGKHSKGFYFSLSEPAPKPDEYQFITQGLVCVDRMVLSFTVLTNEGYRDVVDEVLSMLESVRLDAPE